MVTLDLAAFTRALPVTLPVLTMLIVPLAETTLPLIVSVGVLVSAIAPSALAPMPALPRWVIWLASFSTMLAVDRIGLAGMVPGWVPVLSVFGTAPACAISVPAPIVPDCCTIFPVAWSTTAPDSSPR